MNTETRETHDDWQPCAAGEIGRMVQRQLARRRNRHLAQLAGGSALAVALLLGGWYTATRPTPQGVGQPAVREVARITCREARELMPAMIAGKLPEDLVQRVSRHLEGCGPCRDFAEQMHSDVSLDPPRCNEPCCGCNERLLIAARGGGF